MKLLFAKPNAAAEPLNLMSLNQQLQTLEASPHSLLQTTEHI
jgi:hypothetical protein